ncbi:hypothetical protein O6H91_11G072000 [Diphasiastrum complanatum]|uniref:Uncharacterized protein n=1 Tax=Diphasiastrum complanatum TaxID=34168 RepID=A0ACC2CAE4_DIPCM|nr:hypothetical protein O6H91_11G072000 [Diphasiastrum complanatum]
MGNYMACATMPNTQLSGMSRLPSNTVRVMYPNGIVEEFRTPVVVAELMLENPQHFVWESSSVNTKQRAPALPADAKLEVGQLYYLLPSSAVRSAGLDLSSKQDCTFQKQKSIQKMSLGETLDLRNLSKAQRTTEPFEIEQKGSVTHVTVSPQYLPEFMVQNCSNALEGDSCSDNSELQMAYRRHVMSKTYSWKPKLETVEEAKART